MYCCSLHFLRLAYMVTWSSAHHWKFIIYQNLKGYQVPRAVLKLLHGQEGSCLVVGKVLLAWPNNILHCSCSVLMTIGVEVSCQFLPDPNQPANSHVPPYAEGGPAVDLEGLATASLPAPEAMWKGRPWRDQPIWWDQMMHQRSDCEVTTKWQLITRLQQHHALLYVNYGVLIAAERMT